MENRLLGASHTEVNTEVNFSKITRNVRKTIDSILTLEACLGHVATKPQFTQPKKKLRTEIAFVYAFTDHPDRGSTTP